VASYLNIKELHIIALALSHEPLALSHEQRRLKKRSEEFTL